MEEGGREGGREEEKNGREGGRENNIEVLCIYMYLEVKNEGPN